MRILPWFVTMTLEVASGTLIPAARKVRPMTESGIPHVFPRKKKFTMCDIFLLISYPLYNIVQIELLK